MIVACQHRLVLCTPQRAQQPVTGVTLMRWNPQQYAKFHNERSQPFFDLLTRVGGDPKTIYDLGCGDGRLTKELLTYWPDAHVTGIDLSAEMIEQANSIDHDSRLSFRRADITDFAPAEPVDLIVSNAVFQWIPDHLSIIERLTSHLSDAGTIAFQVPDNSTAASHRLIDSLIESPQWHAQLRKLESHPSVPLSLESYAEHLLHLGLHVIAWETTYLHILNSPNAIVEWMKGTTLLPILNLLNEAAQARFLSEYMDLLSATYLQYDFGVFFPFRRLFCIANRI